MKVFKYLLLPIIGLIGLAAIAIFALFVLVDPNRYKPALESLFARQSGLQLTIAGDINWTFRPVFGLSIDDVRITNGVTPRELASFSSVSLKVVPASVIGGTLEVEEFVADDLHLNWIVDSQGNNNWFVAPARSDVAASATGDTQSVPGEPSPAADDARPAAEDIAAEIQQITIRNARVSIQDAQRGLNTSLENLHFSSNGLNFNNRPFPLALTFRMIDYAANRNAQLDFKSTASVDYAAGNARFADIDLRLSPMVLSGHVELSNFHNDLAWAGELSSNQFNLSHFLENFFPPVDGQDALPGSFNHNEELASLTISIDGDDQGISIPNLQLTLDDATAQADIEYRYASDGRPDTLVYRLDATSIDLDRYLDPDQNTAVAAAVAGQEVAPGAPEAAEQEPATEQATEQATEPEATVTEAPGNVPPVASTSPQVAEIEPTPPAEIPVELLNSMNIIGNHTVGHLRVAGLDFSEISAALKVENGVLTLETQPVAFYQGRVALLANLDATMNPPQATASAGLEGVNLVALAESAPGVKFVTGILNADSRYLTSGRTVETMLDNLTGSTTFSIADNSVNIAMIKQVFATISALSPSGQIGANWPDTLSFQEFDGHVSFTEGLSTGQELQLRMDNLNVTGGGGLDLPAETFDYNMEFIILGEPAVQTVPVNPDYQGIAWPVRCQAAFTDEPRQYCGPDYQRVRELFAQIGRNEVQRRVQEAIEDEVPEEFREAASGLLRNLFNRP